MKTSGPDSLESWMIAVTCSFISMVMYSLARASGMLFLASMTRYNVGRKEASLPFVLCDFLQTTVGPLAGYLGQKKDIRSVVFLGSILASVGVGCCYFATDILAVTLLWGVVYGTGYGFSVLLLPVIINQHFVKLKATATGISYFGCCLGYVFFSSIFQVLVDKYGLSGTFLILCGISMNCIPAAMLLKKPDYQISSTESPSKLTDASEKKASPQCTSSNLKKTSDTSCKERTLSNIQKASSLTSQNSEINHACSMYECSLKKSSRNIFHRKNILYRNESQFCDINAITLIGVHPLSEKEHDVKWCLSNCCLENPNSNLDCGCSYTAGKKFGLNPHDVEAGRKKDNHIEICDRSMPKRTLSVLTDAKLNNENSTKKFNFRVFLDPIFILVTIANSVFGYVYIAFITCIFDFSRDVGIGLYNEKYIMYVLFVSGIVGVLLGWVTDGDYMSTSSFVTISFAVTGTMIAVLPWTTGLIMLLIITAFWGTSTTIIAFHIPIILAEYFAKDKQSVVVPCCHILIGPLYLTVSPFIGYFRDGMGSYEYMFYLLSILCFLSAVLCAFIPCADRYRSNRNRPME